MEAKILSATVLVTLFFSAISVQLQAVKSAESSESPVTNPITYPITRPISSPRYTSFSGTVMYMLDEDKNPAAGVRVSARVASDSPSSDVYTAYTSSNGSYTLSLPVGTYYVSASDTFGTAFSPAVRTVRVVNNPVTGVDFSGPAPYDQKSEAGHIKD